MFNYFLAGTDFLRARRSTVIMKNDSIAHV